MAADNTYAIAYLACDIQAWQHLLGDDLTFVHRDGSTEGKAGQLVRIKSCSMESATSHVETVRVYDDNAAIVTGVIKGNARGRGGFHLVYTRTYVRRGGAWQIVAHQSTDAPGNPR